MSCHETSSFTSIYKDFQPIAQNKKKANIGLGVNTHECANNMYEKYLISVNYSNFY
jgi:hypothetical protein